jgi:hypothetical protein
MLWTWWKANRSLLVAASCFPPFTGNVCLILHRTQMGRRAHCTAQKGGHNQNVYAQHQRLYLVSARSYWCVFVYICVVWCCVISAVCVASVACVVWGMSFCLFQSFKIVSCHYLIKINSVISFLLYHFELSINIAVVMISWSVTWTPWVMLWIKWLFFIFFIS